VTRAVQSLWRQPTFLNVWLAFTLSEFGSSAALVTLPLLATTLLHALPLQMSVLATANTLPFLLLGPVAGVMADRLPRRAILVTADLARSVVLATGVVVALTGTLTMGILYVIAFGIGVGNVWFDIAHGSYLPSVVAKEQLIGANSRLALSQSVADTVGPSAGGAAIQLLGAPVTVLGTALAYMASAALLATNRGTQTVRRQQLTFASLRGEMLEGILFIWRHPLLRRLTLRLAGWHLIVGALQSLLILFLIDELHLAPTTVGSLLSVAGVGTLLAAVSAGRLSARFGIGPTIMMCNVAAALAAPLIPAAGGADPRSIVMVGIALFTFGYCVISYQINNASLRQALTPNSLLGRMGAANRILTLSVNSLGALTAGLIGQFSTVRTAMACFALLGIVCAVTGLVSSPLWAIRTHPQSPVSS
jgi:MFS family permease